MSAQDGLAGDGAALVEVSFAWSWSGDAVWRVVSVHVIEALSEVPECAVTLACDDVDADPCGLLGERAALSWGRSERERHFAGVVVSVDDRGVTADHRVAEVCVAPRLWRMGLREGYRVFQGLDAVAVAARVLRETGVYARDEVDDALVSARCPRAYCVQYGESDLAFVRRLLEEEGVGFTFTHDVAGDRMVLFDGERLDQLWPSSVTLARMGDGGATAAEETLRSLGVRARLGPTRVTLGDWDPRAARRAITDAGGGDAGDARFEFPGRHLDGTLAEGAGSARVEAAVAQRRTAEHAGRRRAFAGEGNVSHLGPGFRFTPDGPDAPSERMVVTRVVHSGSAPEVLYNTDGGVEARDRYANRFECSPEAAPWRPARVTPRPRALAPQSALVTAPAGSTEEIYTDALGRVRVRFHWQRDDVSPQWSGPDGLECSSCWVRVQQAWAASSWGALFTPRVGMEVVVHFLDGDPDRPIVTGCLYNGSAAPPVSLPEHRTRSTLRTQSSPANGGYNELCFEDLADHEEVYLRAQRDQRVEVLHDRSLSTGRDASATVGRDESHYVGRNRSIDVTGDEQHAIEGSRHLSVGGDELREINGAHSLISHKSLTVHADETGRVSTNDGLVIEVGGGAGTSTDMTPDVISVRAPKKHTLAVGDDAAAELTPERFTVKAPKGLALVCGDTRVEVAEDRITLQTKGGAKIELDGDKISVKTSGPVSIKGSQVTSNG